MNMGCFPRLFVLLLAIVIAVSFAGCDIDLPGFGGDSSDSEHANEEAVNEFFGPAGSSDEGIGGGHIIIGDKEEDYSSYINEDGCIVFSKLMSAEGVLQDSEIAIPAYPDGTLMIEFDYQIIPSPDGSLILYVDALSDILGDSDEGPADGGNYELPNGNMINSDSVHEQEDGMLYLDYGIAVFNVGECRTYLIDDETYAVVSFKREVSEDEEPYVDVVFVKWDDDIDTSNDILIKRDRYRLEDQFLLSTKEYVYDSDGGDTLILIAANGKEYDSYEQRYDYTYYEYGVRVADAYNFPTKEIRYEGNTNKIITHYESTYNEYCTLINWKQIDENGVVYWEVNYAGDGSSRILNTAQRRPWEGYEIYTEYEDGMRKIAYQTFKNCPGMKDGAKHVTYYTDDVATHYDEFDPNGVLLRTVYFDEEFNPGRVVYYDKDGNITKEENFD